LKDLLLLLDFAFPVIARIRVDDSSFV